MNKVNEFINVLIQLQIEDNILMDDSFASSKYKNNNKLWNGRFLLILVYSIFAAETVHTPTRYPCSNRTPSLRWSLTIARMVHVWIAVTAASHSSQTVVVCRKILIEALSNQSIGVTEQNRTVLRDYERLSWFTITIGLRYIPYVTSNCCRNYVYSLYWCHESFSAVFNESPR